MSCCFVIGGVVLWPEGIYAEIYGLLGLGNDLLIMWREK